MHAVAHRARAAKVCAVRRDPPRGVGSGASCARSGSSASNSTEEMRMGRESSPAEAGLPSLEDPASAIWAIGRATNAIPAPMSPIGLTDPGDDAGPDPMPVAAVRLATAGPRAAARMRPPPAVGIAPGAGASISRRDGTSTPPLLSCRRSSRCSPVPEDRGEILGVRR